MLRIARDLTLGPKACLFDVLSTCRAADAALRLLVDFGSREEERN